VETLNDEIRTIPGLPDILKDFDPTFIKETFAKVAKALC